MIILPVRYSDDPTVNATVTRMVNNMAASPLDFRRTHDDKTIAVIQETIRRTFGDFARSIRITVN